MGPSRRPRPVSASPASSPARDSTQRDVAQRNPAPRDPAAATSQWPEGSLEAAQALHRLLAIGDRQWHALKGQPQRRAAEQLAAALVQLLDAANPPAAPTATPAREAATALTAHALGWLQGELRDPGCPQHGR